MQTYLVYFVAFSIVLFLAYLAQRNDRKKYLIYAALILSLLAGLRATTVGIDTENYSKLFAHIADGRLDLAYGLETSFKYICAVLLGIWNNSNFLFTIFALITNILIFVRLWDYRDQISITWSVAIYLAMFYFMTFNILRQFVAIAIIFYGTRYLARKKYVAFLAFVAIAFLFHKSAILGAGFLLLEIFSWKQLSKIQRKYLRILIAASPVVAIAAAAVLLSRYVPYISQITFNFGAMLFVKVLIFLFTLIVFKHSYTDRTDEEGCMLAEYSLKTVRVYYLVGLLVAMLGYVFMFMERIGLYFYVFEIVYVGMFLKSKRVDFIFKMLIAAFYLLLFALTFFGDGQGQSDYLFFWQAELGS